MAIASILVGCNGHSSKKEKKLTALGSTTKVTEESLLDSVQKQTFNYFWDGCRTRFLVLPGNEFIWMEYLPTNHDKDIM